MDLKKIIKFLRPEDSQVLCKNNPYQPEYIHQRLFQKFITEASEQIQCFNYIILFVGRYYIY